MQVYDVKIGALGASPFNMSQLNGTVTLVVNVASRCGLTPQYAGLERLHEKFCAQGFTVLGVPCNQFGAQEPGTDTEIAQFCSATYGVTFPMTEKVEVNGDGRHPLYAILTQAPAADGKAGDIEWNFEKFLVSRTGEVIGRFRPDVTPEDDRLVSAIVAALGN